MIVRIYNVDDNSVVEQHCKDWKDIHHFKFEFSVLKLLRDKDMVIKDNVLYILAVPFSKEYDYENLIPSYFKEAIEKR